MSPQRMNPRAATTPVLVEPVTSEGSMGETTGDPVTVYAAVDSRDVLTRSAGSGEVLSRELTLMVYPTPGVDVMAVVTTKAWVTVDGHRRQVESAHPVRHRGRLVYLEVTT